MAGHGCVGAETATAVVAACYTAGGATALVRHLTPAAASPDIHATLTQHIMVAEGWMTKAGAALLDKGRLWTLTSEE